VVNDGAGIDRRVGFVGLGRMGAAMCERLARADVPLRVHDVDPAAASGLTGCGDVVRVPSATAVADEANVVILMLPNSDVVEQVLLSDGLLEAAVAGTVIVDMGSSEPLRTRALATEAVRHAVELIDAPVSGGVGGAVDGTLTIMVGGRAETLERIRPLLSVLGSRVVPVGPAGAGHAVKALNNLMSAAHLLASSEALRVAEAFGLDLAVVLDAVNTSSGRSGSTENKWPNFILPATYDSGFSLALMVKDMEIGVGLADACGIDAAVCRRALERWLEAAAELAPNADHTEIAKWVVGRQ
jgi:3-hydroxyisobutyrate dehydrogenase